MNPGTRKWRFLKTAAQQSLCRLARNLVPLCFYPSIPATVAQWLGRSAAEPKGAGSIPRRGGRFSLGAEGTLGQMHPLPWCLMLPMLPSLVHRKPWHSDLLEEPVCLMAMLVVCQQEVGAAAPPCRLAACARLANSFQAEAALPQGPLCTQLPRQELPQQKERQQIPRHTHMMRRSRECALTFGHPSR